MKQKAAIKAIKPSQGITIISKRRSPTLEEMEHLLLIWMKDKEIVRDTITELIFCERAIAIYCDLKTADSRGDARESSTDPTTEEFKASRGWFEKFKRWTRIPSVVRHGEASSADTKPANDFVKKFEKIVEDKSYIEQQVFNCDETGLFWKKIPSQTYITAEEKKMPGHKPMKDQLTLDLCVNASLHCKIMLLLVYHPENRRTFKAHSIHENMLHVLWRANSKALVTRHFFVEWVNLVFGLAIKKYLQEKNLPLKGLLCINNALLLTPQDSKILSSTSSNSSECCFGPKPELMPAVEEDVDEIVSLGMSMGLEVDEDDITELFDEHHEELTTEEVKELYAKQNDEFQVQLSESEDIKEVDPILSSAEIKQMLAYHRHGVDFIDKHHPEKLQICCVI
ncbi:tigger transposable element-derived protein 1-like [Palaemon carinicauda]|uniref:tigger transposable element-derived protein 1-like n=1 Tax=Palaemon carinicauda TaxID=392227 RepID=UPI0035B68DDA